MLRRLQEVFLEALSSWNLDFYHFPQKKEKKLNLRQQAGSDLVAKRKLQQVRQEQSKYLFKSPNRNPGVLPIFY